MKTLLFTVGLAIILGLGAIWLHATPVPQISSTASKAPDKTHVAFLPAVMSPTVGTPSATPATIVVNTPTVVTVTVAITPTPISNGVNLLRLGATGTQPTILGVMYDDGKNGDAVAGDGVYTLQVPFNEPTAGQIQVQVSAAFQGRLQRVLSGVLSLQVWNVAETQTGSGLPSAIPYPPTWTASPSSNNASDGLYLSAASEEEAGQGISVVSLNAPLASILLDPNDVLIAQSSQTINGRQWLFVVEQEPQSGLQFYHAFLQTSSGVVVIGGNDSPSNEGIVNSIILLLNP